VWMFPGQGSQRAGMAEPLSAAAELFAVARSVLPFDLEPACTTDPRPAWTTERLQPAMFVVCVAAARALQARNGHPAALLGHSLGEFAALVAGGALSFEDGLAVVAARGRAMDAASRTEPGGMAAVLGLDLAAIEQICDDIGGVWPANLNSPGQIVISGRDTSLALAAEACRAAGAGRVVRLEVPIAAHSPLMAPAADELRTALESVELGTPSAPIYSVVDARPHTDPAEIRNLLVEGVVSPVRFWEAVEAVHSVGIGRFVEVGPGGVLSGLARRTVSGIELAGVASDEDADTVAGTVSAATGGRA
ncbi:MAG: ACP S-malonyltransferase, partial [Actinomycetota bacterium]